MLELYPTNGQATEGQEPLGRSAVNGLCPKVGSDSKYRKIIEPRKGWQALNLKELWRYRELLYFLVWRDVKVRYKQTVLGAAWAILQPVMTMLVFSLFFGKLGGMSRQTSTAYPVYVFAALLPWTFFSIAISQACLSLLNNINLVSKVFFPRLLVPLAAIGGNLVDFAISFVVMLGLMIGYGIFPTLSMALLPLFVLAIFVLAVGVGTLLAALVVAYRDFRFVITFLVQIWMFASPVAYSLDIVPPRWQLLYSLNPLAGIISGFRSALLNEPFRWDCISVSLGVTGVVAVLGIFYFRREERKFADII